MPRPIIYALVVLVAASLVPLALVARARQSRSDRPRIHLIQDMDNQPRFEAQAANAAFADGRAMRPPVTGTVPFGQAQRARPRSEAMGHTFPVEITAATLERGRQRYAVFCAPCHGLSGYGDGMVDRRASALQEGDWTIPTNLHDQRLRDAQVGFLYQVIRDGSRAMPAYASQIPVEDRWAIAVYLRALQRSQDGRLSDVPVQLRDQIQAE